MPVLLGIIPIPDPFQVATGLPAIRGVGYISHRQGRRRLPRGEGVAEIPSPSLERGLGIRKSRLLPPPFSWVAMTFTCSAFSAHSAVVSSILVNDDGSASICADDSSEPCHLTDYIYAGAESKIMYSVSGICW